MTPLRSHRPFPGPDGVHRGLRVEMVDVSGGYRNRAVAELGTDQADINTLASEFKRMCVPQRVWVHTFGNSGTPAKILELVSDLDGVEWLSLRPAGYDREHGVRSIQAELAATGHPFADQLAGLVVNSNDSGFVAFAVKDADASLVEVNVLRKQRQCFGAAESGSPEQHDQRTVSGAAVIRAACVDESQDLFRRQRLSGELPALIRRRLAFAVTGHCDRRAGVASPVESGRGGLSSEYGLSSSAQCATGATARLLQTTVLPGEVGIRVRRRGVARPAHGPRGDNRSDLSHPKAVVSGCQEGLSINQIKEELLG